jgi:MFS family permease
MRSPLSDTRYARLFSAQVIALFGTGLTTVALSLLAYDLAGGQAGVILGAALALKMVAYVGIAPIAGALAHRLPRRALLVGMDLVRACVVMAMPFVTEVWQIFVLIFILNACAAVFTPTFQATIPDLLSDEARYTRALSLSRLAYDLEKLLSPIATAAALMLVSYDGLFLANGLAFLISAGLVGSVVLPNARPPERVGGWGETLGFGLRVYLSTPRLRGLLALSMAVAAGGAMVIVNTVVIVQERFGGSDADTAIAFAAAGAGSMLTALVLPRVLERVRDRPVMLAGAGTLAAGLLAMPTAFGLGGYTGLLAVWFVLGVGSSLIQTPSGRLLRRSARAGDRPSVFSAQFALSHACWFLAYPFAGWAGAVLGIEATAMLLAVLVGLGTGAALLLWPQGDPLVVVHAHPEVEHLHVHVHDAHHQHEHEGWEGPEPHSHPHYHPRVRHSHAFMIDTHHQSWPGT